MSGVSLQAACVPCMACLLLMINTFYRSLQIRVKGSLPLLGSFPESLLNYCKGGIAFFRPGAAGDHKLDEVSIRALGLSEMSRSVRIQLHMNCNTFVILFGKVSKLLTLVCFCYST